MSEEIEEESKKSEGRRKFTASMKARATVMWKSGDYTADQIATEVGIARRTVLEYFKEKGIVKGSAKEETEEAVRKKMIEESAEKAALHLKRVEETKENHYTWATLIGRLTMAQIVKAQKESIPFAAINADLKSLEKASQTLRSVMEQRYKALGLDNADADPGDLPELLITELTADQIEEIKNSQEDPEDDDLSEEERELAETYSVLDDDDVDLDDGVVIEGME